MANPESGIIEFEIEPFRASVPPTSQTIFTIADFIFLEKIELQFANDIITDDNSYYTIQSFKQNVRRPPPPPADIQLTDDEIRGIPNLESGKVIVLTPIISFPVDVGIQFKIIISKIGGPIGMDGSLIRLYQDLEYRI